VGSFGGEDLVVFLAVPLAVSRDRQHVSFDGEVDGVGIHAGEVQIEDHLVAVPMGVHGDGGGRSTPDMVELLGEAVVVAELVETYKHRISPLVVSGGVADATAVGDVV
jgi:hypothetical protein